MDESDDEGADFVNEPTSFDENENDVLKKDLVFRGHASKVIRSDEGQRRISEIENTKGVLIEIGVSYDRSRDWKQVGISYDQRNFQTKEGITVSFKRGNIALEKADILVNSANEDLSIPRMCGKAFIAVGGKKYVKGCSNIPNTSQGNIASTDKVGLLNCTWVLHAVCCRWDDNKGEAEEILSCLIKKILDECQEKNAKSLAMPYIGTGKRGFPDYIFNKVLKNAVVHFSSTNPDTALKDIRVLEYEIATGVAEEGEKKQTQVMTVHCPGVNEKVVIKIIEGDVTNTELQIDAIINKLPIVKNLPDGSKACQNIFLKGGPIIQEQLHSYPVSRPGSVIATGAGCLGNTQLILHFIPNSTKPQDLQESLEQCLDVAIKRKVHSVAIPLTAASSPETSEQEAVEVVFNAAQNCLTHDYVFELNVCVWNKETLEELGTFCQNESEKGLAEEKDREKPKTRRFSLKRLSRRILPNKQGSATVNWAPSSFSCKRTEENPEETVVTVTSFSGSSEGIDEAIEELNQIIKRVLVKETMGHVDLWRVLKRKWSEVEKVAAQLGVTVTCTSPTMATVEGTHYGDVTSCKDWLLRLIDPQILDMPGNWEFQLPDHLCISLEPKSDEFQEVLSLFQKENKEFREIIKIERIQNGDLYKKYLQKKHSMVEKEKEMRLFHGTSKDKVKKINTTGFTKRFSATPDGKYGEGIYFTKSAPPTIKDHVPDENQHRYVYLAKVLVGEFTAGEQGMKTLPSQNVNENPEQFYHSAVDDTENPQVFVVFLRDQCYPEYLITFT